MASGRCVQGKYRDESQSVRIPYSVTPQPLSPNVLVARFLAATADVRRQRFILTLVLYL
jgi:hypothetical protein